MLNKTVPATKLGKSGYYEVRLRWRPKVHDIVYWNEHNIRVIGSQQYLYAEDVAEVFYQIKTG